MRGRPRHRGRSTAATPDAGSARHRRAGLRTIAVVLVATAVPVASLLGASVVAKAEVERRAMEGLTATAKATVVQEEQAWDNAVRIVESAARRPVPISAIASRDTDLAAQGADNILVTGPFSAVRLYDASGHLVVTAAPSGVTPTPVPEPVPISASPTFGDPVVDGAHVARQISVPLGLFTRARLVVDVDMTQILGKPSALAFGRTGTKFLVTPEGVIVSGSTAVGTPLRAAENRAIAAAGKPTTKLIYSPFFKRLTVESFQPVPGQKLGILVQQSRAEVMHAADNLAGLLRWAALGLGALGVALAASLAVFLGRRGRRLAASERGVQEAQARLASIVQASTEAIIGMTPDGVVTSWNHGAESLFGYDEDEIIGRSIEVLIPPERRQEAAELRARVARGLAVSQHETVRLDKDGTRRDVASTMSPIEDADGKVVGIAKICWDIGERKRAEMALREHEEQLAAARDEALEASRLKSQFLSNTSHEIRTPMTVIVGMNEMLLETDLDPMQRKFAEGVARAGASLMAIITDILDFSKIEAGRLDVEISRVALRPLLDEIESLLSESAHAKGLAFSCSCLPGAPEVVRGDAVRLRQVLLNLGSNAVKFTESGHVDVVASRRETETGVVARIEVIDSGIGIAPDDRRLLFQPFSQVDASSTRTYGGTGLGLAISAELVEAMGGRIGVESTPGAGSTFWFEVPAEDAVVPAPAI